jgi:CHASE2 domain-containing sensor protein
MGAVGEGMINASPSVLQSNSEHGVLRQVPTLAFVNQLPFLSLPLEMVRLALGDGGQVVPESGPQGMTAIRIGDYRLPTQANGELLLHFGRASSNYYLSAADVLASVHPPELFASRFVIIGFNSTGLQDRIVTPSEKVCPASISMLRLSKACSVAMPCNAHTGCHTPRWPRYCLAACS